MKHITPILIATLLFGVAACSEKDIETFGTESYLVFEMPGYGLNDTPRDSMVLSFPALGDECQEDTLWFKARIIGLAVPYERTISININEATSTAKESENFTLPSVSMPADSYTVDIPLIVYRTGIQDTSVRLELNIEANEYFGVGFEETSKAVFIWGDKYIKPDNWDSSNYHSCFGEFTETRYAFILETCGIIELPDPQDLVTLGFYNAKVREALYEYNQGQDKPLQDELGIVTFPVWTGVGGVG